MFNGDGNGAADLKPRALYGRRTRVLLVFRGGTKSQG